MLYASNATGCVSYGVLVAKTPLQKKLYINPAASSTADGLVGIGPNPRCPLLAMMAKPTDCIFAKMAEPTRLPMLWCTSWSTAQHKLLTLEECYARRSWWTVWTAMFPLFQRLVWTVIVMASLPLVGHSLLGLPLSFSNHLLESILNPSPLAADTALLTAILTPHAQLWK